MKDTRYHEGDVVKVDSKAEELQTGAKGFAVMYAEVVDVDSPQSDSPDYRVRAYMGSEAVEGWFKASGLEKVEDWELETRVLLEERMEVEVRETSYGFYEKWGATSFEARGTGVNGESEWIVFNSREQARNAAEEKVKQDLRENPSMFNDSFMRKHTYITETDKRAIANDEARARLEGRSKEELAEMAQRRNDVVYSEPVSESSLREDLEMAISSDIQEQLDDPFQYFVEERGIYTQEELGRQDFTRMNIEEAADDAVATDGTGHFLDVYDGRAVELENGAVAYGTN